MYKEKIKGMGSRSVMMDQMMLSGIPRNLSNYSTKLYKKFPGIIDNSTMPCYRFEGRSPGGCHMISSIYNNTLSAVSEG